MAQSWTSASSAVPCPYCGCLASRSHRLKCPRRPMPCELCHCKTLTAASIQVHMQNECPMRRAPCAGCGEHVLADALQAHIMSGVCGARTYTCQSCEEVFWIGEEYIRHALPRCTRSVVPCQLCGHAIATSMLAEHYQQCASSALLLQKRDQQLPQAVLPKPRHLVRRSLSPQLERVSHRDPHMATLSPLKLSHPPPTPPREVRGGSSRSPLRMSPARLRASLQNPSASPTRSVAALLVHSVLHDAQSRSTSRSASQRISTPRGLTAFTEASPQPDGRVGRSSSRQSCSSTRAASVQSSSPTPRRSSGAVSPHDDELLGTHAFQDALAAAAVAPPSSVVRAGARGGRRSTTPPSNGVAYQTRSSMLRANASQVRISGGPASLSAKDARQHALSDQIRKREKIQHAVHQIDSHTPVLPSCVTQPLSTTPHRH